VEEFSEGGDTFFSSIARNYLDERVFSEARDGLAEILTANPEAVSPYAEATLEHIKAFVNVLIGVDEIFFFRTRFCMGVDLKHDYLFRKSSADWRLRAELSEMDFPRYVWLTEIFTPDGIGEKKVCGEIIIDATGIEHDQSILWFHLPGIVLRPSPDIEDNEASHVTFIFEDCSYPLFLGSRYTQ